MLGVLSAATFFFEEKRRCAYMIDFFSVKSMLLLFARWSNWLHQGTITMHLHYVNYCRLRMQHFERLKKMLFIYGFALSLIPSLVRVLNREHVVE
jgi:hypothetical protein